MSNTQNFFPGYAQELGLKGEVPSSKEKSWIAYLLGPGNYHLAPHILESKCPVFVLGDSNSHPSTLEIKEVMKKAGAQFLSLMSHSGGYAGLNTSLKNWDSEILNSVNTIVMLDNFYSSELATTMKRVFGTEKLNQICKGFRTQHNTKRFNQYSAGICPQVELKLDHKLVVKEFFK